MKMICGWERDASQVSEANRCPLPCALSGLLLQGAAFHSGVLHESSTEASELCAAPAVTIGFVAQDVNEPYRKGTAISIPTYFSTNREEYLMELQMPCEGDHGKWVLAGVALFLTDDL